MKIKIVEYGAGVKDANGNAFRVWTMKSDDPREWRRGAVRLAWEQFVASLDEVHIRSGAYENVAGGLGLATDPNQLVRVRLTGYSAGRLVW